jgi:hypothetical protein
MKVKTTATPRANSTRLAHQSRVAKERRLDRENVESRDVAACVPALEHQHLEPAVRDFVGIRHAAILARVRTRRPTQSLNQSATNDSRCRWITPSNGKNQPGRLLAGVSPAVR